MKHPVFGEITFSVGWKASRKIQLFGNDYDIKLKVQAYFEEDGITSEQEQAYLDYSSKEGSKLRIVEELLNSYSASPQNRFTPKTLLFQRDGSYALLCDDNDEPDEGIAVCLAPSEQIVSQDEYL